MVNDDHFISWFNNLKLGDLMTVTVGPGLGAFTLCVTLSLLAAASFDPHSHWDTAS